jgi:hypothetical protein
MKSLLLAAMTLAALAATACHERKAEPRPDYDATRGASDRSQQSLDKEAGKY